MIKKVLKFQFNTVCCLSPLIYLLTLSTIFTIGISPIVAQTYVDQHGKLSVSGKNLVDKNGTPIQLKGMSLFWSSYGEGIPYFNENTVKNLWQTYKCTVIRAPLAIAPPGAGVSGYETDASQANMIKAVIDAAIKYGIYVVVDFHAHEANKFNSQAKTFFKDIATTYKGKPNIIYEIWNEPLDVSWSTVIRPYHQDIVSTIRAIDTENVIVCGTRLYDQVVNEVASNPVTGTNIMYAMHFYAATPEHQVGSTWLGAMTKDAVNKNVPLFVTEFGTCEATGAGGLNQSETKKWFDYLDQQKISYINWGIYNKSETAAALLPGTTNSGSWPLTALTPSGKYVLQHILSTYDGTVTAVKELSMMMEVTVFPNPAMSAFTLQHEGHFTYTILNQLGQSEENGAGQHSLTVGASLLPGTYTLLLQNDSERRMVKIVKL